MSHLVRLGLNKLRGRLRRIRRDIQKETRMKRHYLMSAYKSRKYRGILSEIERYCMFIGYPRSGHTLVGSLLDAHPETIIAHELDALIFIGAGFSKQQLFTLILENSQFFSEKGRRWTGYSYSVPNQWQGTYKRLRVIGDKRGGKSSEWLRQRPELIELLYNTVQVPVKFIHVIRNPFDNISSMFNRGRESIERQIDRYFTKCESVVDVIQKVGSSAIFNIRLEELIIDPVVHLRDLCDYLEVETPEDYLNDCASIVMRSPHKSRFDFKWTDELINHVQERISQYHHLDGYTYDK